MTRRVSFLACAVLGCALLFAQQKYPVEPAHDSGQGVTPAYEGYFENSDGSLSMVFGYYNRNLKEIPDIPIGPENRIEPGGPDRGQPTHFLTARQWGVFAVTVPKGFNQKLMWTLTVNGKIAVVPANLDPLYLLSPFKDATGNTPPFIGFAPTGAFVQGPAGQTTSLKATWPQAVPLTVWVADDANIAPGQRRPSSPPISVSFSKYRGPGTVTFSPDRPQLENAEFRAPPIATVTGKVTTTASFSEAGEYTIRVVANDWTGVGGGGFECCWTNAEIKVSVSSAASAGR